MPSSPMHMEFSHGKNVMNESAVFYPLPDIRVRLKCCAGLANRRFTEAMLVLEKRLDQQRDSVNARQIAENHRTKIGILHDYALIRWETREGRGSPWEQKIYMPDGTLEDMSRENFVDSLDTCFALTQQLMDFVQDKGNFLIDDDEEIEATAKK